MPRSDGDSYSSQLEALIPADDAQLGHSRAHASVRPTVELAGRVAELLEEPESHQLAVTAQLGIPWSTYHDWMSGRVASAVEFRAVVLRALEKRRRADLDDMVRAIEDAPGSHAATIWNMRKFRHEGRFKRFYADEPTKVELTGKDGGPIEQQLSGLPAKELLELYAKARKDADEGGE